MGDKNSLLPDVITPLSEAIQQNVPETIKETDNTLSAVVGFFNNVVLYPVKKANLTFRYKLEAFEDDLREKIKNIPEENLQVPPTIIAGPALEALRYAYDEADLREMYQNLLASAMDNRISHHAHPAFVDIIKQMSPLDARILKMFSEKFQFASSKVSFAVKNTERTYINAMPDYFVVELADMADPFAVSESINNLHRLELIKSLGSPINNYNYEVVKNHPYVLQRADIYEKVDNGVIVFLQENAIRITDFGKRFSKICL